MTTKKTTSASGKKKKIKISEDRGRRLRLTKNEVEQLAAGAPSSIGTTSHCSCTVY